MDVRPVREAVGDVVDRHHRGIDTEYQVLAHYPVRVQVFIVLQLGFHRVETRCKDICQALHLAGVWRVGIAVGDAVDDQFLAGAASVKLQQQRL